MGQGRGRRRHHREALIPAVEPVLEVEPVPAADMLDLAAVAPTGTHEPQSGKTGKRENPFLEMGQGPREH